MHTVMDPEAAGPLYCREQIKIPPTLPDILKEFTKAATRTQPVDAIEWAAAYFQALVDGTVPPVKERVEVNMGGVSCGSLAVLHRQLCSHKMVSVKELRNKWRDIGLDYSKMDEVLRLEGMADQEELEWIKVLSLGCSLAAKNLPEAMKTFCIIVTTDPEGGASRISIDMFERVYSFLATVDGDISQDQITRAMQWLRTESARFDGTIGPHEFLHPSCPCLTLSSQ